jgi:hypothetical protein
MLPVSPLTGEGMRDWMRWMTTTRDEMLVTA